MAGLAVCVATRLPRRFVSTAVVMLLVCVAATESCRAELHAGAARVDITRKDAGPVEGRLHARALVLSDGSTKVAIVTLDVVAIGEIGYVDNSFLSTVRARVQKELQIPAGHVIVNASHCHGVPCRDVAERTVSVIATAAARLVPVRVGVGVGHEDRIMVNRRLRLKNGREIDVRHAYSMPPDDEVAAVGPIDPEIGVLRLNKADGTTLAVVYNFACHPIQGVPSGANTADITGFASEAIEANLPKGAVALFVQGCGGDINPAFYKDVHHPRSAESLGNTLALSTLRATRSITCRPDDRLRVVNVTQALPRADLAQRIDALESQRRSLVNGLKGTSLNLKTFMQLAVKHGLSEKFPSYYSHRYLHEQQRGRAELTRLDDENRRKMEQYVRNVYAMEHLTRVNTNLRLLKKHQAENVAAGRRTVDVELVGLRVGDFVLTTFPGELTVPVGLALKEKSPHEHTFIAGYTNGYIYYCPTAEQLANVGGAQEDSDCILDPEWHRLYEARALELLRGL